MAVENANLVHALGVVNLNNPPEITRGFGIKAVTRLATGQYEIELDVPLNITQGMGIATLVEGDGMIAVNVRDYGSFAPANIIVTTFSDAGAAADLGFTNLVFYRFPTID